MAFISNKPLHFRGKRLSLQLESDMLSVYRHQTTKSTIRFLASATMIRTDRREYSQRPLQMFSPPAKNLTDTVSLPA
jgi:hypothetical protein